MKWSAALLGSVALQAANVMAGPFMYGFRLPLLNVYSC